MHRLHAPAILDEAPREPVEQPGMRRLVAQRAEVVGGGDDSLSKMPAPHAVGHDARRERVLAAGHPARELETAALLRWQDRLHERGLHHLGEAALALLPEGEVAASDVNRQGLGDVAVRHTHDRRRVGRLVFQRHQVRVHDVQRCEPVRIERIGVLVGNREESGDVVERVERGVEALVVEFGRLHLGILHRPCL